MDFKPYSVSKIQVYNSCPRSFKYKYIDKLPEPPRACFVKGRNIHKVLETYPQAEHLEIVEKFLKSDIGKQYSDYITESKKCMKEVKVALTEDLKQTSFFAKDAWFRGIVDLMFVKDQTLHLCDYKTGKAKDLQSQDFTQLIYYAVYFFVVYKYVQKVRLSFVYVEHNTENVLELSRESCETYTQRLKQNVEILESDTEFVPKKSWKCNYCSFKNLCETKC